MCQAALPHLLLYYQYSSRNEAIFCLRAKSLLMLGCVQASTNLSVCLYDVYCLPAVFRIIVDCESCMWPISINPASKAVAELGWRLFYRKPSPNVPRSPWCCGFGGVLRAAGFRFFRFCFPANAHAVRHVPGSFDSITSQLLHSSVAPHPWRSRRIFRQRQ